MASSPGSHSRATEMILAKSPAQEAAVRSSNGMNFDGISGWSTGVLMNVTGEDVNAGITSLTIDESDMSLLLCVFKRLASGTFSSRAISVRSGLAPVAVPVLGLNTQTKRERVAPYPKSAAFFQFAQKFT